MTKISMTPTGESGSAYENYNKRHDDYDLTRLPVGVEQVAQYLRDWRNPSELSLLDAGCGTGLHLQYFNQLGLVRLIGMDASIIGVAQAAQKFAHLEDDGANPAAEAPHKPVLLVGDFRAIPLPDQSLDVVHVSFAVHHLPHKSEAELKQATRDLFAEFARVLKPGGKLIVVSTSRTQLHPQQGSLWYYRYFQDAARVLAKRFLPRRDLVASMHEAGFETVTTQLVQKTYWTAASLDANGPFDEHWRNGDSLFAFYRDKQELLQKRLARLKQLIADGSVQKHIAATRQRTESVKQAYILVATRTGS
ncbi:MAG: hypothetical protein QG625_4028 [Cyanobacteriota bacterium erpe_2018_sw_39hr_WHONDRS-SW48-000098_B_bin.30]|jgi:SAM-dependent methyltransferase|nr:class I SAM-dependent methyltransferase [Candidatus Obscuribacter sp.]MDQ5967871.1 hypothetical protein [Cyanobacteriota bacterium erpe_2018_sw_39hr_WHONDRS-SW48-000098_B_bin.30]